MKIAIYNFVQKVVGVVLVLIVLYGIGWYLLPKSNSVAATRALQDAGYTHIQTQGAALWGCGNDDFYCTRFTATGPSGRAAQGVVGSGIFKGSTIRLR